MMATLCSYENCFGPSHPQTLALMTEVAAACCHYGDAGFARRLLQRVIGDLAREQELRVRALGLLRDLFLEQSDLPNAARVQRELLECLALRLGEGDPRTAAARLQLESILLAGAKLD